MAASEEDVKRQIALERERLRLIELSRPPESASPAARFASGTKRGIAQVAGAPVDLVNALGSLAGIDVEEPVGGSVSIERGLQTIGGGAGPETELGDAGTVGEVVGPSIFAALATVGAGIRSAGVIASDVLGAKTGSIGLKPLQRPGITSSIVQDVARTAQRNPITFGLSETAAAGGAGGGRVIGEELFPDSQGAQAMAEIIGGFSPFVAFQSMRLTSRGLLFVGEKTPLAGAPIRATRRAVNKAVQQIKPTFATERSQLRVRRGAADPEKSLARVGRKDIIPDSGLTAAQRAGDEGLLELERSVLDSSEELGREGRKRLSHVNRGIRDAMIGPESATGFRVVEGGEVPLRQVREHLSGLLDTRIQIAAEKVAADMARIGPSATREDMNRIARRELRAAKDAGRAQERQLYQAIPDDASVPTDATRETLDDFVLTISRAQRGDVPQFAKDLLSPEVMGPKGELVDNPNYLGDVTDINEMRGLSSRLRENAREARAANRFNEARISDDIADSIADDIANAVDGDETLKAVDTAVHFSRDFNTRFVKNKTVAALLGHDRTGAARVEPALTLETTVGTRSPRSKVANDRLLNAVRRNPENRANLEAADLPVPTNLGDEASMRVHIRGFLIDDFRRAAVDGNSVDPKAAQRWMNENQDIMQSYPELRRELEAAQRSGGKLIEAERGFDGPESAAAVFMNSVPDSEIEAVINAADPQAAMQVLRRLVRQDTTGQAERGLKQSFLKNLLNRSAIHETDFDDFDFVSGARMTEELQRTPILEAATVLFTPDELKRIDQVRRTAILMDAARKTGKSTEGIIGDEPSVLISLIGKIAGAQTGRVLAGMTGGGTVQTPGILSGQAQKMLRSGVQDPARRLLTDAISAPDDRLFRALLLPLDSQKNVREVHARLNAWVVATLAEQHAIEEQQ